MQEHNLLSMTTGVVQLQLHQARNKNTENTAEVINHGKVQVLPVVGELMPDTGKRVGYQVNYIHTWYRKYGCICGRAHADRQ